MKTSDSFHEGFFQVRRIISLRLIPKLCPSQEIVISKTKEMNRLYKHITLVSIWWIHLGLGKRRYVAVAHTKEYIITICEHIENWQNSHGYHT